MGSEESRDGRHPRDRRHQPAAGPDGGRRAASARTSTTGSAWCRSCCRRCASGGDDLPLLAQHFVEKFRESTGRAIEGLSAEALGPLLDYAWPGNVRELENAIEYAFVKARGGQIEPAHLPPELLGGGPAGRGCRDHRVARRGCRNAPHRATPAEAVRQALAATGWNIARAAATCKSAARRFTSGSRELKIARSGRLIRQRLSCLRTTCECAFVAVHLDSQLSHTVPPALRSRRPLARAPLRSQSQSYMLELLLTEIGLQLYFSPWQRTGTGIAVTDRANELGQSLPRAGQEAVPPRSVLMEAGASSP